MVYYSEGNHSFTNGNVGIGTTNPGSNKLHISTGSSGGTAYNTGGLVVESSGRASIQLLAPNNSDSYMFFGDQNSAIGGYVGHYGYGASPSNLMVYYSQGNHSFTNGNVGIGTTNPTEKLAVNGTIRSKEVKVEASPWPDYVFKPNYHLMPLHEVANFVKLNKHLPEIPSAAEIDKEGGVKLGEMNIKLLQKIEELTLYMIELKKEIELQQLQLDQIMKKNKSRSRM